MLNMPQICTIREMYANGCSVTEIARALNIDRKTVYRYIARDDFSLTPPKTNERPSKLDPYKEVIEGWLESDRHVFKKQRHTIRRIQERLVEECGFNCPYATVSDFVRKKVKRPTRAKAYLDLVWEPGSAQADFGTADAVICGELTECHYLVVAFPHSNMGFAQLFLGESGECFCQGLKDIFEHIGGVPHTIVFDNASGLGKLAQGQFKETEFFTRFKTHYGFTARYCSPASGWQKGAAERKVAFLRTELLVPVPTVDDIGIFNIGLLARCSFQSDERHYAKGCTQGSLFNEDCKRLFSLPAKPFDIRRYELVVSDGYGHVTLDDVHVYSSAPEYARTELVVAIGAQDIIVTTRAGEVLARHRRRFGSAKTESIDALAQLRLLTRRPRGWQNSRIRSSMPQSVVEHLDACDADQLRRDLKLLYDACERSGLDATLDALDVIAKEHADFPDFFQVGVLAARIAGFGLDTPPEGGADLTCYDVMFLGGGADGQ